MAVFRIDRDVSATTRKILAKERADALVAEIATVGDPGLRIEIKPFEVLLQDDVDRTRDRVGTIDRCAADRNDVDPVDQLGRNRVEINLCAAPGLREDRGRIGTDKATAVDQRQRALRAEILEIDEALPNAKAVALIANRRTVSKAKARQLVQRIGHIGVGPVFKQALVDHRCRLCIIERRTRDARTSDDNDIGGRFAAGRRGQGGWSVDRSLCMRGSSARKQRN